MLTARSRAARPRTPRRQLAAAVASRFGVLRGLRQARLGRGLFVLAYHRIGDGVDCPVDGDLFSVSERGLADQIRLLQRWARIAPLEEVRERYRSPRALDAPLALLTFDDAYRDNYTTAYPLLRSARAAGVFFVATGIIGCRHVPWWDRLAYAVQQSRVAECRLEYPADLRLTGLHSDPRGAILEVQRRYKRDAALDKERFVRALEAATGASALAAPDLGELFAGWDELKEMADGGMAIQTHTHTHRLLSHLTYGEQYQELEQSRDLLRQRVGSDVSALAYPVGSRAHFNDDTRRALKDLGYELAFSHYGGWNRQTADPYDIRRVRIDPAVTTDLLRASVVLPSVFAP
jgi:peptidoglycan/xylan/chitin deacetylase (PgdA/CDA1 family)